LCPGENKLCITRITAWVLCLQTAGLQEKRCSVGACRCFHVPVDGWQYFSGKKIRIIVLNNSLPESGNRGGTVFNVLCYKTEGRFFDPTDVIGIFYSRKILPIALWPWGLLSL